jgi:hypothetical protein
MAHMTTENAPAPKTAIDRSKTYVCRFSCGFETTWPAALGRHESAKHNGSAARRAKVRVIPRTKDGEGPRKTRVLPTSAKIERLLDELRKQQDEILAALKKATLLVLADRDLRSRESERIRADLHAVYEVLERNRNGREQRLSALMRY